MSLKFHFYSFAGIAINFIFLPEVSLFCRNSLCFSRFVNVRKNQRRYGSEELDQLLNPLKERWKNESRGGTLFDFFVGRVKKYLRICVSMDPSHPHFQRSCAANPALFTSCSVIWFDNWSEQSEAALLQDRLAAVFTESKDDRVRRFSRSVYLKDRFKCFA